MTRISQQQAEDLTCEFTKMVERLDSQSLEKRLSQLSDAIGRGHPEPNILAWLYEFGQGCLAQLIFFRDHPSIPLPTPQACEPFRPYISTQLDGVKDIVSKQKKSASRKRLANLA